MGENCWCNKKNKKRTLIPKEAVQKKCCDFERNANKKYPCTSFSRFNDRPTTDYQTIVCPGVAAGPSRGDRSHDGDTAAPAAQQT